MKKPIAAAFLCISSILLPAASAPRARAQAIAAAELDGTVADPTGAVVPQSTVIVTNTDTGAARSTTTNNTGQFSLPSLPVGPYRLEVKAKGFKTTARLASCYRLALRLQ